MELLTHRLVEARMVVVIQAQYIVDLERRMAERTLTGHEGCG